jgi:hypothetical protein
MTRDHDPLDRYMNAFGGRLEAAASAQQAAAPRHRRRLHRAALIGGPIAALALTAVLLLLPGSTTPRRLDVLAEARAALAPHTGQVTHLVVRQHIAGTEGTEDRYLAPFTLEQWSATKPVRWRVAYEMPHASVTHPGERVEVAYAGGVEQEYFPKSNHIRRVRGVQEHPAPAISPLGTDPVAALRSLLARGGVRDAGTARIGDRDVRRLVGTLAHRLTTKKGERTVRARVEYDVDPATSAPVRARIELALRPNGAQPLWAVFDFKAFERLPLTAESEKLLTVQPGPGVSITEIGRRRR